METEKAAELGFCTGVRRAIDILEKAAQQSGPLVTLGPVVHNQRVMEKLSRFGIRAVESVEHLEGDTVAISSHGVSPVVVDRMKAQGLQIVDTTCPFVRRAQVAAKRLADAGFFVVIFGEASHPEVEGVLGWAKGKGIATLELPRLERGLQRVGILSQTTQSFSSFIAFVSSFTDSYLASVSELRVVNTICDATRRRQEAALDLAKRVDMMLVVVSRRSANTRRLTEICAAVVETHLIDGAGEIDSLQLGGDWHIGVTAGASTPDEAIEEVIARLHDAG